MGNEPIINVLKNLPREEQEQILSSLEVSLSPEAIAKQARRMVLDRRIAPLENERAQLLKSPSTNRSRLAELKKQLEPLYSERDRLSK